MDPPAAREVANVGIVAALFAAGAAIGGPVGGAIGDVAGEMAAGLVERGWRGARDRFLGEHGILEPDLQAAMRRSYACAVNNLERRWTRGRGVEWRSGMDGDDRGASGLFESLRHDEAALFTAGRLRAVVRDPVALEALGNHDLTRGALRDYLDALLHLHDEGLATFVRGGLEPELAACFAEELKTNNRARHAYERLALAWLLDGVAQVRTDQGVAAVRLAEIAGVAERLEAGIRRLEARPAEEREPGGEAVLDEIVAARDRILADLAHRTAGLETVVIREGGAVRAAVADVGDRVSDLNQALADDDAQRWAAAFESVDRYFQPFEDSTRVFSHAFPLVGRDRYLTLLTAFASSPRRVAVLSGPGGIGKSRILKEALTRIESVDGSPTVYMLSDPGAFESTMLDALPAGPVILAVDDAHRLENLGGLLAAARRNSGRLQVVLAVRPHAVSLVRQALRDARFPSEEVLHLDVPPLTRPQMGALAREALGEDHAHLAAQVVDVTGDSPLVTVVAARLLALHQIAPDQLREAEQAREEIFSRFQDVLLGQLGGGINPARVRDILDLVSAIGPFRAYPEPLVERAASFLGLPIDQFRRSLEALVEAGALTRAGGAYRVIPDLLSDYILRKAAVTDAGESNGYANRVFEHFGDLATENLLGNLEDLLPREVLRFVRAIVDRGPIEFPEPTLEAALRGIPTNPYEGLPPILRKLSSDRWLRVEAFDLLWRLGRDDRRATNPNPDHPIRVLQDLADIRLDRHHRHYDALLDAIERWIGVPDAFAHRFSPVDILDRLLAKEASEFRVEGKRMVWREYPVRSMGFCTVRRRAIRIVAGLSRRDAPAVQHRALTSLLGCLWVPVELDTRRFGPEEAAARTRENDLVIDAVRALLGHTENRLLSCVVERHLRPIQRWAGDAPAGAPHRQLLAEIPTDHSAKLARYLWLGWTQIDFFADETDYERRAAAVDQEIRQVVAQLVEQEPDATHLKARLERELDLITRYAVEPRPGYLLQTLGAQHPDVASPLADMIIADPASPLVPYLPAVLLPLSTADLVGFRRALDAAIESTKVVILAGTARVLAHLGSLGGDDRAAVRRLAARPEPEIAVEVLGALRRFPPDAIHEVDELAATVEIGSNPGLADALCEVYQARAEAGLSPDLWDLLLGKLVPVAALPNGSSPTHDLIDLLVRTDPVRAVEFFVERIRRSAIERDDDVRRYQPVPHAQLTQFSAVKGDSDARREALSRVTALMVEPDGVPTNWLVELFAIMSGGFDEVAVQVLDQLVADEGHYGIQQVQMLIREAPAGFLFAHADFVACLLESARAAGADVLEGLQERLISAAALAREMDVVGEPPKQFVSLKERAAEAADHHPPGSPIRTLFEQLADEAEDRIRVYLRNDNDDV